MELLVVMLIFFVWLTVGFLIYLKELVQRRENREADLSRKFFHFVKVGLTAFGIFVWLMCVSMTFKEMLNYR